MRAYYRSPLTALFRQGAGRFALIDTAGLAHQVFGSRVQLYGDWRTDRFEMTYRKDGSGITLAAVDGDAALHTLIQADVLCQAFPIATANLDVPRSDLTLAQRAAVGSWLADAKVPVGWIQATTTGRDVLRFVLRVFDATHTLTADVPTDLDQPLADLTQARRDRILAWLAARGQSTSGITTVRELVERLGMTPQAVQRRLGGEAF